jgi:hypothetical protein
MESATDLPRSRVEPTERQPAATRLARRENRHRVSNGKEILPGVDGRSLMGRRYRDISAQIIHDQGGLDMCSESRLQLIRRFSAAAVIAEQLEAKLANGEAINIAEHALLCSTLTRLSARIGIDRRPRIVTPSVSEYLSAHRNGAPHNGAARNGAALDLKVDQTNAEAIDADPIDTATS